MSPSAAPMSVRAFFMSWCGFWVNWVSLKCARKVTLLWLVYSFARRTASYQWPLIKPLLMASEESWLTIVYGPCELEDNCRRVVLAWWLAALRERSRMRDVMSVGRLCVVRLACEEAAVGGLRLNGCCGELEGSGRTVAGWWWAGYR